MHAVELISPWMPEAEPPETPAPGVCCVLGTEEPCIARSHAIKPSFTNLDLLAAPLSRRVSVRAWRVLEHAPTRQACWLATEGEFRRIDRAEIRALVIDGVHDAGIWSGYATTSYKKHGCLRAPVNSGGAARWLWETEIVDCSEAGRVAAWWARILRERVAGIPRACLESLECEAWLVERRGVRAWLDFAAWAEPRRLSPLYRFLCYLLPSQQEIDQETRDGEQDQGPRAQARDEEAGVQGRGKETRGDEPRGAEAAHPADLPARPREARQGRGRAPRGRAGRGRRREGLGQ